MRALCAASVLLGCSGGASAPAPDAGPSDARPARDAAGRDAAGDDAGTGDAGTDASAGDVPWPAGRGCAMAHCDPRMSDGVGMEAPAGPVAARWHDATAPGANIGLGCASNGTVAVCSLGGVPGDGPYLRAYDADGRTLWTSRDALGRSSYTSAPIVTASGGAVAADETALVRFDADGTILWRADTAGGRPISPTVTAGGAIVLATSGGPVSAHDGATGEPLGTLELREALGGEAGRFETRNTPAARGDRVYVSTEFVLDGGRADPRNHARLYAIDVDPSAPRDARLRVAWFFEFGARSGASPLVVGDVVYFDGDRPEAGAPEDPHFFAVRDDGEAGALVWSTPIEAPAAASAAEDPRGGLWIYALGAPELLRLSFEDGGVLQRLDTDALVDAIGEHSPSSALSVARGPDGHPALLLSASTRILSASWVVAIDLVDETLLWRHRADGLPAGQFPIVRAPDGEAVVVYATFGEGVFGISP